jgi:hypothetical protein
MASGKNKNAKQAPLESTSGVFANGVYTKQETRNARQDRILEARYVRTSKMFLQFADGLEGTWTFRQLCLDMSNMKVTSIKASPSGNCIHMKSKWGDDVELDTSSLRALIDPEYAALLEAEIASMRIPSERLERIAAQNQPPQEWYDSTEKPE